ncbi:MAG: hypothetical protein J1E62_07550 [Lachnospiraceae bacterium]|nr:hypothetical protein [Lachnospiraceae bacterium]
MLSMKDAEHRQCIKGRSMPFYALLRMFTKAKAGSQWKTYACSLRQKGYYEINSFVTTLDTKSNSV